MYVMLRKLFPILLLVCCTPFVYGQVATGVYTYGTFDNKGFDTVNVGNLNVHFEIPIVSKPGRGLSFSYVLAYDSSVWYPYSGTWTHLPDFGWTGIAQGLTGYITYNTVQRRCFEETQYVTYYVESGWAYHDAFGRTHYFPGIVQDGTASCATEPFSFTLTASDGSGYTMTAAYESADLTTTSGTVVNAPLAGDTGTIVDSNGNQLSADNQGHYNDTTGLTVVTVSGSAPNPTTFTYTDTGGHAQTVTLNYRTYTVQTNFGCSVGEYGSNGTTTASLVDNITFPDGSAYHFAYEATPGHSSNVTGRLASVTLPQGGVVSYSYSGGNNGIVCADGGAAGLTRSLSADSGSAASTWTYARTPGTGTSHTEVTDGQSNHSAYDFVIPSGQSNFYETNRSVYQGAESGTPLLARQTCYNGQAQPCTTAAFTLPVAQIDTYETLNGSVQHGSTAKYNTTGLQTDQYDYDFGTSSRGALLRHEVWTYGGSIAGLITVDQVYDGSGSLANQTNYAYDETTGTGHAALVTTSGLPSHIGVSGARGNLTTVSQWINSSGTTLSTMASYEDTGDALNSTSPTGQTSYSYDSTHAFVSTTTPPTPSSGVSLPVSATTDVNTGLTMSTTDPNGTKTTSTYDSMLRPIEIDNYDTSSNMVGKTTYTYYSTQDSSTEVFQSASTPTNTSTLLDGYGRHGRTAVFNGQSSNQWYQQDVCYDANGNISFQSYAYQGTEWGTPKVCSGSGDSYTYDALRRVKTIAHADGTTIQYSYTGRATQVADENGVSRITQVDGLGRTTVVCEISSNNSMPGSGSPTSCGTDITGTGFTIAYTYDLANHKTTVVQGSQTRIFQTDWLGRTILTQEPERGQTTYSYSYNSTGLAATRQRPKANQTNSSTLTTTTTQYDVLGRVLTVNYNDGTTPNKQFVYDANTYWSQTATNLKGHLAVMGALTSSSDHTGALFSYDAMGRVVSLWQCTPSICGTSAQASRWMNFSYDWAGNLTQQSDPVDGSIGYSYSPADEVTQVTGSYSVDGSAYGGTYNLVSSVQNGSFGPASYQLGNGLTAVDIYDSPGRRLGGWVCNGSTQNGCSGGTQLYGYTTGWSGLRSTGRCDTVLNTCASFGYDEFNRLTSVNVNQGTVQNFSWSYDRYGNRWLQNVTAGSGTSFSASFNTATNQISSSGYSYDAAGNMTGDGFHSYTYDAEGNLTQVDGGTTASYVYDALNRRVRAQVAGNALGAC